MSATAPPSATTPAPSARFTPARLLGAALVAGAGFSLIVAVTAALGYGQDLHALRVLVTLAIIVPAALVLVWPNRKRDTRIAMGLVVVVVGAFAWWFVPSRPGGMNLTTAAAKRESLRIQLPPPNLDDVRQAASTQSGLNDLAKDYPTLAEPLRSNLDQWADAATAAIVGRLKATSPGDARTAREARARQMELAAAFPDRRESLDGEFRAWVSRAVQTHVADLEAISLLDWDGFDRSAILRQRLVKEYPDCREELAAAERVWVTKSTGQATAPLLRSVNENPRQVRELCRDIEKRIRSLRSLDTAPDKFRDARSALFSIAHEAAEAEVRALTEAEDFDLAFTLALRHDVDWLPTTRLLGPAEQKSVAELRESARRRMIEAEKSGRPARAPEPREREIAPLPREKS